MNDNFQVRMLFEHTFNELNKALRPVFRHLRIMLGVRKSDVLTSRFGWSFLIYREFVECGDEFFVFLFHRLRCHSFHSAKLEADTRSIKSGHSNPWTCLRAASLIHVSATDCGSLSTRANTASTNTF